MDKIYEYEDKIEEVKFLLSALKIQTAFVNIMRVAQRKKINYQRTFIDQLQTYHTFQIIHQSQQSLTIIEEIYEKIKTKLLRRSFQFLLHFSQRQDKRLDRSRKLNEGKEDDFENKMMPISVINQQDWKQKLTSEQLQMHCRYYREKIEQVEKSFADFFQVIKKQ